MSSAISCQITSIGELLRSSGKLIIPPYQRNYSWDEENYADLWMDIQDTFTGDLDEYFLGSVVIDNSSTPDLTLIDGQQRITTTTILICALKWHLLNAKLGELANLITQDFLNRPDYDNQTLQPNLELNLNNRDFFLKHIITADDPKTLQTIVEENNISSSNQHLAKCYILMCEQIAELAQDADSLETLANAVITSLREKVFVIRIDVEDDVKAYTFFETLNNRGVELSVIDLVKNYLFSISGPHLDEMRSNWEVMTKNLGQASIIQFFRHYWISHYAIVQNHGLMKAIKNKVRTAEQAREFSEQITRSSDYYGALQDPNHELWVHVALPETENIIAILKELSILRVQQCYILALSVLEHGPTQILDYLTMIKNFTFRYNTICGRSSSLLQRAYMHSAHSFRENPNLTAQAAFDQFFKQLYPHDNQFQSQFSKKIVKTTALARYILSEINNNIAEANAPHTNADGVKVDLEHIAPKKFKPRWADKTSDFPGGLARYINRLGNMTLIDPKLNSHLGNADFKTKKQVYQEDCLSITERILDEQSWTAESINRRQNWLAGEALKIWRFPVT